MRRRSFASNIDPARATVLAVAALAVAACSSDRSTPTEPTEPPPPGSIPGVIAYVARTSGQPVMTAIAADGSGTPQALFPAPNAPSGMTMPTWSPDGSQILFTLSAVPGFLLAVANAAGSQFRTITQEWLENNGAWSPDGSQIVYTSTDFGGVRIVRANADGSSPDTLTIPGSAYDPAWSPDGSRIAYRSRSSSGSRQISVYDLSSGTIRAVVDSGATPVWSPDGRQLAYTYERPVGSNRPLDLVIAVVNADGTGRRAVSRPGGWPACASQYPMPAGCAQVHDESPTWSPDGTRIAFIRATTYLSTGTRTWAIHTMRGDGSDVRRINVDSIYPTRISWRQ